MPIDLADLERRINQLRERQKGARQLAAQPSTGALRKATLLDELATLHDAEGDLWASVADLPDDPTGRVLLRASHAAEDYSRGRAQVWRELATEAHRTAERKRADLSAVFADDGMTYVPGRGRVRRLGEWPLS